MKQTRIQLLACFSSLVILACYSAMADNSQIVLISDARYKPQFAAEPVDYNGAYVDRPRPVSFGGKLSSELPSPDQAWREAAFGPQRLVDGSVYTPDELKQDPYGKELLKIRQRRSRYGFLDGLFNGSIWSMLPFLGLFVSVGSDIAAAHDADRVFDKMLRHEPLSRDEAIKATLWSDEQNMRANGTGWYTFGSLIRKLIVLAMTFGFIYAIIADKKKEKKSEKSHRQKNCERSTEELE